MARKETQKQVAKPADEIRKYVDLAIRVLLRCLRKPVLLVLTLPLAVGAFLVGPRFKPPTYATEAVLLHRDVMRTDLAVGFGGGGGDPRSLGPRLCGMLMSGTRLETIMLEEELYASLRADLGMKDAVEEFRKDASCRSGQADTIRVAFQAKDPEIAYRVGLRLANELISIAMEEATDKAEKTLQFLQAEFRQTSEQLKSKGQERSDFLGLHPEFASEAGVPTPKGGAADNTTALRRQANRLRRQLNAPETAAAPQVQIPEEPKLTRDSQKAIAAAEASLASAQSHLAQVRERFTPRHPEVIAAQNNVAQAMSRVSQVRASAEYEPPPPPPPPVASTSGEDRLRMRQQLAGIERMLRSSSDAPVDQSTELASLEFQWTELSREVEAARQRHQEVAARLFRATALKKAAQTPEGAPLVMVDRPYMPQRPTSSGPRRTGAMFAVGISMLWWMGIIGLALLDDRIYTASELKQLELGQIVHVQRRLNAGARRSDHPA